MDVTVVGAGVAGLTCAVELAERGVGVEVVERSAGPGPVARGAAAGEVAARSAAAGGIAADGVAARGAAAGGAAADEVAASGLSPLAFPCCSWFAGGMLAPWCELENAGPLIAKLGTESLPWWREHVADTATNGTLLLAHGRDAGELVQFSRRTERFEWLDGPAIAALEPDLAGRFNRALFFPDEGHLDPRNTLASLERRLETLGVPVKYGVSGRLTGEPGPGSWSVDCTGLAARQTLTDLRGVKGEMLIVRLRDISLSRPVRILHPRMPVYVVPRRDGLFMVGATVLESDQSTRISVRSMLELLSAAYALHPAFGEAEIVEIGAGVRPAFPDNLPRIRQIGNTLYVNGLYRHGFLVAPALARRVAEIVLHGRHFPEVTEHEDTRERCLA
jgi:glycine oxidase